MKNIKTIAVMSQFNYNYGLDEEYTKSVLEAYSDYNTAINHMDEEVLSFINDLIFRKWDITYTDYIVDPYDGKHDFRIFYRDNLGKRHAHGVILEFVDLISWVKIPSKGFKIWK